MRKNRKFALMLFAVALLLLLLARALWRWVSGNPAAVAVGPVGGAGGNLATPHYAWSELLRGNRDTTTPPIAPFAVPPAGTVFDAAGAKTELGQKLLWWAERLEELRTLTGDFPITARPVIVTGAAKPLVVFWSTHDDVTQENLRLAAVAVVSTKAYTFPDGSVSPITTGLGSFASDGTDPKDFDAPNAVVWTT